MGQAKNRGSREQRVAEAKAKIEALKPDSVTCNNCHFDIKELTTLDTKGMAGIDAAFAGICPSCTQTTWAISGDSKAAEELMHVMESLQGDELKVGFEQKLKKIDKMDQ